MLLRPPISTRSDTLFPYTTLFRSVRESAAARAICRAGPSKYLDFGLQRACGLERLKDRDQITRRNPKGVQAVDQVLQRHVGLHHRQRAPRSIVEDRKSVV